MRDEVKSIVRKTAFMNGAIAVVLSPIPLADELVLLPIFASMTARIARFHALKWAQIPWKPVMKTAASALVARGALNLTVSYIPGVAAVANAVSAVTVTHFLGGYIDDCCADPQHAHALTVKDLGEQLRRATQRAPTVTPSEAPAA